MQTTEMTLVDLNIRRRTSYEEMSGRYVAEVKFQGSRGNITLPLSPEISEKLMEYLAPLLARFGSDAAAEIAASVLKAVEDRKATEIEDVKATI